MEISATTRSLHLISKTSLPTSLASANSLYFNNVSNDLLKKSKKNCLSLKRARAERNGFNCRSMFGLGVPEIAVIAGVTTLLFGPKMVPELGKSIGQTVKSFQQVC
ncbi:hypothetical protein IFM89_008882 [Coptis chinensis]|uniref:Sec-independent protein translocase protein TATA, chloroplastic n=1 Tax=Coptis chinensis TaxID=261450 RepID=A0A835HTK8_9MAGN|nr:hypothetical protein IFM89_003933 [Coptis chinensis]KAF9604616.1 hypothetical protein IFM89_008882 [Coptis chinensis]